MITLLLGGYAVFSLVLFLLYGYDKYQAQRGGWRVPEARLHLLSLFGGWPGGFLAQRLFRHKTCKRSFQLSFWLIGLLHLCVLSLVLVPGLATLLKVIISQALSFTES